MLTGGTLIAFAVPITTVQHSVTQFSHSRYLPTAILPHTLAL